MKPIVLVLLLNGIQISMPAPALLLDGRAWVPLRPIAERLGWHVALKPGGPELSRADGRLQPVETRLLSGHTYVPARWLEKLGAQVAYDGKARTLQISAPSPPDPAKQVSLADVLSDPAAWAGRMVELVGEFLGHAANPLWDALRFGPPVGAGDWVLRGDGGAIYCAGPRPFDFPAKLGRRCKVTGRVELTSRAVPYIRVGAVEGLSGRDALCCCILTDKYRYSPAEPIKLKLLVRNDAAEPLQLTFPSSQIYDFRLLDSDGKVVWQWSRGKMFLMAIMHRKFEPNESKTFEVTVQPHEINGLKPGVYFAEGELHKNAKSYREKILVVEKQ